MGIEPTPSAWEAEVLPLNYTRVVADSMRSKTNSQPGHDIGWATTSHVEAGLRVPVLSENSLPFSAVGAWVQGYETTFEFGSLSLYDRESA